ncbi:heavy-metal-associated domain-containing protein [Parafilimonas terrae]|uniref:Heavy-metal-associated domain-containing protein n=1 Tax=Parafilimonas terrae TaxID=1465490 RepID=A0A1I5RWS8_9BACT|nr:heavy metal-associated domain-containing protein [Parafilimonas terrae]SFP62721.1 Heavy-metal-associated domain-containing protein [Parafilimonas terrae]
MTHTYTITGMTCNGCASKVQKLLAAVDGVEKVDIHLDKNEADITMHHHVQTSALQNALKDYPKYQLAELNVHDGMPTKDADVPKPWFATYKPVLLIFMYITGITLLIEANNGFNIMHWMNNFMGAFFIVFSFFKMLDLKGFAESYFSYDIIAKKWMGYGYLYAFIELALGIAFIAGFNAVLTNTVTLIVMAISIIGVLQSVFNKRKIKCACLGAVFNLPMSTITIIEDLLMILMSAAMLLFLLA